MTEPAPDNVQDFVARISDVLRFVFAQQRGDRELLSQLQAAPPVAEAEAMDDIGSGRTRIRRINDTLLVAL